MLDKIKSKIVQIINVIKNIFGENKPSLSQGPQPAPHAHSSPSQGPQPPNFQPSKEPKKDKGQAPQEPAKNGKSMNLIINIFQDKQKNSDVQQADKSLALTKQGLTGAGNILEYEGKLADVGRAEMAVHGAKKGATGKNAKNTNASIAHRLQENFNKTATKTQSTGEGPPKTPNAPKKSNSKSTDSEITIDSFREKK